MKSIALPRIPVYVDLDAHGIFEKLTSRSNKKAEDFPFETMKDLFVAAASLGAKRDRYVEVKKGKEIFDATLFNPKTEIPILYSLAHKKQPEIDVFSEPRHVLDIAQRWANGGIYLLEDQILNRPGRPLFNLVDFLIGEIQPGEMESSSMMRQNGFSEERDNELTSEKSSKNFSISDCADLLTILEVELRHFIAEQLSTLTTNWWKQRIPNDIKLRAEKRKADREEPYPGRELQDRPLYDYLDFPDLKTIITMKLNWEEVFKNIFYRSDFIQVKLDEVATIRNDIAHHRDVPPNDREIFVSNSRQIIRAIRKK